MLPSIHCSIQRRMKIEIYVYCPIGKGFSDFLFHSFCHSFLLFFVSDVFIYSTNRASGIVLSSFFVVCAL